MPNITRATSAIHSHIENYFQRGIKRQDELAAGVEWEKVGVYRETGRAIGYSGPNGVEGIFRALIRDHGWKPVLSGGAMIALQRGHSSITLEPGGQIELSGQKYQRLEDNARELYGHLDELKAVSEPLGIAWLGIGMQPVSALDEIEWVPKERYRVMRAALAELGTMTHNMMKQTASIQVSLDYTSEADAVQKLRLAMALSPLLSAMFANSPLSDGGLNGYYSKRALVWQNTALGRTGIIEQVFDEDYSFADYTAYALSLPLLFIVRGEKWLAIDGLTFGEFLRLGWQGYHAEPADWDLHISTIFTEARFKQYVEIRSIDCQKREFGLSVPALLKGLFYDEKAREAAWSLVAGLSARDRHRIRLEAPKMGLKTRLAGSKSLAEASLELVELAGGGLDRIAENGLAGPGERAYLKPLAALLSRGEAPADILIRCFQGPASKDLELAHILRCAAI